MPTARQLTPESVTEDTSEEGVEEIAKKPKREVKRCGYNEFVSDQFKLEFALDWEQELVARYVEDGPDADAGRNT